MKTLPFSTKLPADLAKALDEVCRNFGLRKNYVVETALREKIEDLLDAEDLRVAIGEATAFEAWEQVKNRARKTKRK